jgi:hypothetical protein
MYEQPAAAALDVLPVFNAVFEACEAFVSALVRAAVYIGRECLME